MGLGVGQGQFFSRGDNLLRNPPACRVRNGSDILVASGATVPFDTEDFDTDGMHSVSVNTSRITINTAGLYLLTFTSEVDTTGSGTLQVLLSLNGSSNIAQFRTSTHTGTFSVETLTTWKADVSDFFELLLVHSYTTVSFDTVTSFTATRLGSGV